MQPKKDIVSFLALKKVRTAPAYDSPKVAFAEIRYDKLMFRSEHPQDYEGVSDLFPKYYLEKRDLKGRTECLKELIFSQNIPCVEEAKAKIHLHCDLLGLDYNNFINDLSYSAWERIEGTNRVICADSAVKERYHIFTLSPTAYDIIEGSNIQKMGDIPAIDLKAAKGLIKTYEQARALLDPNHCYIIETQSVKNRVSSTIDHFVVQVHRGIDSQKVDFEAKPWGWNAIKFSNVRGATSPTGENLLLTMTYPYIFNHNPKIISEDASAQVSAHYVARAFSELMFRKRRLQIFPSRDAADLGYELTFHSSRNSLSNPHPPPPRYHGDLRDRLKIQLLRDSSTQLRVHLLSDGRKAYMRLLD